MTDGRFRIDLDDGRTVTAVRTLPDVRAGWTFVYAPGAGSNIDDAFGVYASRQLAGRGVATVRFQFPYMEVGRRAPDRPAVLEATWRAVIEAVSGDAGRLVVGGRSMGGRIASQVVAAGERADGLVFFGYPLHPPGQFEKLREAHLPKIEAPMLFVQGTRDGFAREDLLDSLIERLTPRAELHRVERADHAFGVLKRSGRTPAEVLAEVTAVLLRWLLAHGL